MRACASQPRCRIGKIDFELGDLPLFRFAVPGKRDQLPLELFDVSGSARRYARPCQPLPDEAVVSLLPCQFRILRHRFSSSIFGDPGSQAHPPLLDFMNDIYNVVLST